MSMIKATTKSIILNFIKEKLNTLNPILQDVSMKKFYKKIK